MHAPRSVDEVLALLDRFGPDSMLVAGGTDVIPNMKQGLRAPRQLISLAGVRDLAGVSEGADAIHLGAMTTLDVVAAHPAILAHARGLAEATGAVGGPHHRRMGTLGGNLCLDTRCRYYNQTYFWRSALGFCLKKDGTVCHVVAGGRKCVAAASNDTAAMAIALGATIVVVGPKGTRKIPASEFWIADGIRNTALEDGELVLSLRVPRVLGRVSAYEKLRRRSAIDFPLLSIAVRLDVDRDRVTDLDVVVSALAARPRRVAKARALALGKPLAEVPIEAIGEIARIECNPLPNVDEDTAWRKQMVAVLVRRALGRALVANRATTTSAPHSV
jgi:4-hydroxybenzoyl-CoA reductase subunit beta